MSRIEDWGERPYINVYRRGLSSGPLDQLASCPGNFDTLQHLMDISLELDTRYQERQKEKSSHQEKKPPVIGFNSKDLLKTYLQKGHTIRRTKKGKQFQV
ncbi:hypothetical protein O181_073429 [Austropuccinia psidii MF-1]|uniref:Uncharacterized protein n=1 Tax=Austropuccinia psidii MF-1 TaxID=1389203 RepID=A0A9Q3F6N3_9BASI|nr:hypothetical protein [Austropuccinia psidii MF-1]